MVVVAVVLTTSSTFAAHGKDDNISATSGIRTFLVRPTIRRILNCRRLVILFSHFILCPVGRVMVIGSERQRRINRVCNCQ